MLAAPVVIPRRLEGPRSIGLEGGYEALTGLLYAGGLLTRLVAQLGTAAFPSPSQARTQMRMLLPQSARGRRVSVRGFREAIGVLGRVFAKSARSALPSTVTESVLALLSTSATSQVTRRARPTTADDSRPNLTTGL